MSKNRDLGNYGSAALFDAHSDVVANTVVQRTADGSINANNVTASTFTGALSGTATSLATARTITLAGDLSGSASFDGSANVTITATVADDSHNHIIGNVDGLQDALDLKAPLASPTLTGVPAAPTANAGTNTTQIATTAFVQTAVAGLVDAAPTTLDTLNELAAALGDDPNFATTVSNSIGGKAPLTGEGTSGTWGISITGNANTVTNGVYTSGDQTIAGVKTFSNNAVFDGNIGLSASSAFPATGIFHRSADGRLHIVSGNNGISLDEAAGASTLAIIDSSGNVGIGTSSPGNRLVVGHQSHGVAVDYLGASALPSIAGIFTDDGTNGGQGYGSLQIKARSDYSGYSINFFTAAVGGSPTEKMRLTSAGNLGIGTSSPVCDLHVNGATARLRVGPSYATGGDRDFIDLIADGQDTKILSNNERFIIENNNGDIILNSSGHVLPGTNATQDLGSSTLRWNTVYTSDLSLKNDHGDWTIVEGEDDLFLYNNKKGKVYKFALTEVDPSIAPAKRD